MSLVIGCDTGNLTFDDIIRLVSAVDDDGNIYIRTYDDGTSSDDLTSLACVDGIGYLDILRGALVLDGDGEYALNVSANIGLPFLLTSTGTGLGVSTLTLTTNADTLITLDGTARFYSDAGGTLNESTSYTFATGVSTRYIRCPSATSNMVIATNTITSWGSWTSGANAASLSGDISKLTALTYIEIKGNNTLSGNVSVLTSLTYLYVDGANTLSGSVAGLTSLTYLVIKGSNTVTGSIAALTSLTLLYIKGENTVTGSIAALTSLTYLEMTGYNTISGSLNGLTSLGLLSVYGNNTVTGDLSLISSTLKFTVEVEGNNRVVTYTAGGDWATIRDSVHIKLIPAVGYGLSSAEVDLFIIEVENTRWPARAIHLTLTGSNLARTAASDVAVAALIADGGTVTTT